MITRYAGDRYVGLTGDVKPTGLLSGALFLEIPTLHRYAYLPESGWLLLPGGSGSSVTYVVSGSGVHYILSGTGIDDPTIVRTTGTQTISGLKNFTYYPTYFLSPGISIGNNVQRGPFDVRYGWINPPSGLTITKTFDYAFNLWDNTDYLTFEVYAFTYISGTKIYSPGLSGAYSGTGSFDWFKVDLTWSGAPGASGYKVVFGGDNTNNRFRDYYIQTGTTGLTYGTSGDVLTYESPIVVTPQISSGIDLYIDGSGDLHTVKDIYCRNIYALNLTGLTGGTTIITSGSFPSGGVSGDIFIKNHEGTGSNYWTTFPLKSNLVLCSAYTPSGTGVDVAEYPVPYGLEGTNSVTWNIRRATFRVQQSGLTSAVMLQKSTGIGVFEPVNIHVLTLTSGLYETYLTTGMGTLNSNDKVRFAVTNTGSSANWTITMELSNK